MEGGSRKEVDLTDDNRKYLDSAICLIALCVIFYFLDSDLWEIFLPLVPALLVAHVGFKGQQNQIGFEKSSKADSKINDEVFKINKLTILINELVDNLMVIKGVYTDQLDEKTDYRRTLRVPYLACLPQEQQLGNNAVVESSFFLRFIPPEQLRLPLHQMEEPHKYIYTPYLNELVSLYNRVVFLWHERNRLYKDSISNMMRELGHAGEVPLEVPNSRAAGDVMNYLLIGEECVKYTEKLILDLCNVSNALADEVAPHYHDDGNKRSVVTIKYELRDRGWVSELSEAERLSIYQIPVRLNQN